MSSAPRRSRALPPSATTTRSPRSTAGLRLQDRPQDVGELRRVRQHLEVVADPDRGLVDRDDAPQVDRRADDDEVASAAAMIFSISASWPSLYPIAGSTAPTSYFSKVSAIVPTAHGRGSTISAAPSRSAATKPAPNFISPCVSVGPSSTTSTRLPRIAPGSSTVTCEFAFTTVADGFVAAIVASSCATCSGSPSPSC